MAGVAGEESGASRSSEGIPSGQRCQSGELAELRSSDQVENGTPSTSPPYWDTDDEDDGGPKPAELYGKYTWKIEKFSQINKRELRSNAFEVGGYKWYILIYPQGCDVCNHLSLFLCVANHEKLLPGWSHFAQFTIAVVNKDSKKSKYSDTLHRFWKKEHDWGWKKFMELSKVLEGFIESDNLIIKAQVQVIREKADRPFRCLDCNYRRELVRVYLTNVEQVCRRFVEERRSKLGKLIEDKARWSSFRVFWLGIDQNSRRRMSREKSDSILKVVVKHFFIEKEVTSTLVMDSLYSGLKALEGQTVSKKSKVKLLESEEMPAPIVRVEKDSFVLVDDVLRLLERAASEPLPPKDDKGPQNRTKDGNSGDDSGKDTSERDERRLTELGRRTVEIFVLSHIFSNKIEVAYQEAVALKRQEELIREEEAAWLAEIEQKAKRTEKKEKSKKKQAKQKRNNRKGKDKVRDERPDITVHDQEGDPSDETKESSIESQPVLEKLESVEDISDVSDSVDGTADVQPDSEDRDPSPVNWDTDTSEVQQSTEPDPVRNGLSDKKSQSLMDDSSSTCSTDSVPSVVTNGSYLGKSIPNIKNQKSPTRVKNRGKARSDGVSWENDMENQSSVGDTNETAAGSSKTGDSEPEAVVNSLRDHLKWLEKPVVKKEEEVVITPPKKSNVKDPPPPPPPVEAVERSPKENKTSSQQQVQRTTKTQTPQTAPTTSLTPKSPPSTVQHTKPETHTSNIANVDSSQQVKKSAPIITYQVGQAQKALAPAKVVPAVSRPSSAPLAPPPSGPRPNAPVVSMVQTSSPLLSRSMSAAGRLGPDPSPATHSFVPQSYRNAMMMGSSHHNPNHNHHPHIHPGAAAPSPSTSASNQTPVYFLPQSAQDSRVGDGFAFGKPLWDPSPSLAPSSSSLVNDIQSLDLYGRSTPILAGSGPREHPTTSDEFPHLDIINDLLDDENGPGPGPTVLSRQFTFPGDLSSGVGPSGSSSCRFERTRSYHEEGFDARTYGSSGGGLYDPAGVREFVPQAGPVPPYSNGQLVPSQWQMAGPDMPVVMMGEAYPYYNLEYPNIACGVNGYTMFRPSNGH